MANLDDLINYEKEFTGLDFKRIQYDKKKHEDLIKDIMSMANADIEGDRYIIIGVDYKDSNDREIIEINKDEFVNSATYQQLIRDNIEPQIIFDYFSHEIDNKCLGIFKIIQCNDQPYMMKKAYGNLRKGDCFIRKGDAQFSIIREDFDRIIAKKINGKRFNGKVEIYFSNYTKNQEIALPTAIDIELPSEMEANKIRNIIEEKKELAKNNLNPESTSKVYSPLFSVPIRQMSIEELEKKLLDVGKTYEREDLYEFFELRSHKLNIMIINEGDEYIEDASLQIDIDKIDGLVILDKIYFKPNYSMDKYFLNDNFDFRYPKVEDRGANIRIHNSSRLMKTWNIRHQIPEEAFLEPVRFLFLNDLAGHVVQLKCKLFGKNLKEPFEKILKIKVISNNSAGSNNS